MTARQCIATLLLTALLPGCATAPGKGSSSTWSPPASSPPSGGANIVRVGFIGGGHQLLTRPRVEGSDYVGWADGVRGGQYRRRIPLDSIASFEVAGQPAPAQDRPTPGTIQMSDVPSAGIRLVNVKTTAGKTIRLYDPVEYQGAYVGWIDTVHGRKLRRIPVESIVHYRYSSNSRSVPAGATFEPDSPSGFTKVMGVLAVSAILVPVEMTIRGNAFQEWEWLRYFGDPNRSVFFDAMVDAVLTTPISR